MNRKNVIRDADRDRRSCCCWAGRFSISATTRAAATNPSIPSVAVAQISADNVNRRPDRRPQQQLL